MIRYHNCCTTVVTLRWDCSISTCGRDIHMRKPCGYPAAPLPQSVDGPSNCSETCLINRCLQIQKQCTCSPATEIPLLRWIMGVDIGSGRTPRKVSFFSALHISTA